MWKMRKKSSMKRMMKTSSLEWWIQADSKGIVPSVSEKYLLGNCLHLGSPDPIF